MKKYIIIIIVILLFGILIYCNIISRKNKKEDKTKEYIEMDAIVSYSCKDYSVFSAAEFSSFIVFKEPIREYYDTVVLVIDTKNTSIIDDDEVIEVRNRDPKVSNSSGGDIYEYQ